jgi:hypothetical protein
MFVGGSARWNSNAVLPIPGTAVTLPEYILFFFYDQFETRDLEPERKRHPILRVRHA